MTERSHCPVDKEDKVKVIEVGPLKETHLEDAAKLVSSRYRQLCNQEPNLPDRYKQVENLLPLLGEILDASGIGVAAFRGKRLIGFLTGWHLPSFRGKRSTYSPEWANAAALEDSQRIYEELYSHLAPAWAAERYIAHYISLFPNDVDGLRAWHWMGFGMIAVDAIRGLDPIQGQRVNVRIRRAEPGDLEPVIDLHEALWQYSKDGPIFLLADKRDQDYYEEWLRSPDKVVWLADWNGKPVSFLRLGPADNDVCTIIYDEKTTSIYGAFTMEGVRGKGIATALLDKALNAARTSGYARCAVSFEPMNLLGTRFWCKHFRPVCFSLFRCIDERVTQL